MKNLCRKLCFILMYLVFTGMCYNANANQQTSPLRAFSREEALSYDSLASSTLKIGDYENAAMYKEAFCQYWLDNFEWRTNDFATQLNNLAYIKFRAGLVNEAIDVSKFTLGLRRLILDRDDNDFISTINNLAHYYENTDNWEMAIPLRNEQICILDSCNRYTQSITPRIRKCQDLIFLGRYSEAIFEARNLLSNSLLSHLVSDKQKTSLNYILARGLLEYGNPKEALNYALLSFKGAIGLSDDEYSKASLQLLFAIGNQLNDSRISRDAIRDYRNCNNLYNPDEDAVFLNYLANSAEKELGKMMALDVWRSALNIMQSEKKTDYDGYASLLVNFGSYLVDIDLIDEASNCGKKALEILSTNQINTPIYVNTLHLLATCSHLKNENEQTFKFISEEICALRTMIDNNFLNTEEFDRFYFINRFIDIKDLVIYLTLDNNESRFNDLLYSVCLGLKRSIFDSEFAFRVGRGFNVLDKNFRDVQSFLDESEVAVEFINTSDEDLYAAVVCRKNWDCPKTVFLGDLGKLSPYLTDEVNHIYSTGQMTNIIWKYILEECEIKPNETIYFSADGILNRIAIEYLPLEDNLFTQVYKCYRVTSTSRIGEIKSRMSINPDSIDILCWDNSHNNLTNTDLNSSNISDLAIDEVEQLIHIADENGIKSHKVYSHNFSSTDSSILHIATHGFFNSASQGLSPIEKFRWGLKNSGIIINRDGKILKITAEQFSESNLSKFQLISLASCKSNEGVYTFDGMSGLSRGLFMGGASAIITTLWDVNDAITASLFGELYMNVFNGIPVRDSLINGILHIKNETETPYYWIPYIVTYN